MRGTPPVLDPAHQIEPSEAVSPQSLDTCNTLRLKTTTAHELQAHGPLERRRGEAHRSRKFVADDSTAGSFASKPPFTISLRTALPCKGANW